MCERDLGSWPLYYPCLGNARRRENSYPAVPWKALHPVSGLRGWAAFRREGREGVCPFPGATSGGFAEDTELVAGTEVGSR